MDPSVTFGAFTWDAFGGSALASPNREIDIEDSRWGDALAGSNSQFAVQPFGNSGHRVRYLLPNLSADPALTRIIDWRPTGIRFLAVRGHHLPGDYSAGDLIFDWSYVGETPLPGQAVPRLNLWANNVELGGVPPPAPASGSPQEVIVSKFVFQPAASSARDFSGDGKSDILWQDGVSGQRVVWLMNGTSLQNSVWLLARKTHRQKKKGVCGFRRLLLCLRYSSS